MSTVGAKVWDTDTDRELHSHKTIGSQVQDVAILDKFRLLIGRQLARNRNLRFQLSVGG